MPEWGHEAREDGTGTDHERTAVEANRFAMRQRGVRRFTFGLKALVHAILALVEQQRIANLLTHERLRVDLMQGSDYESHGESLVWDKPASDRAPYTLKPRLLRGLAPEGNADD